MRSARIDSTIVALVCGGGITVERGPGGGFGVDSVVLASPPAGLAVRAVDVHHLDPLAGEMAGKAGTVAAGALDTDTDQLAVTSHPAGKLAVAAVVDGNDATSRMRPVWYHGCDGGHLSNGAKVANNSSTNAG